MLYIAGYYDSIVYLASAGPFTTINVVGCHYTIVGEWGLHMHGVPYTVYMAMTQTVHGYA